MVDYYADQIQLVPSLRGKLKQMDRTGRLGAVIRKASLSMPILQILKHDLLAACDILCCPKEMCERRRSEGSTSCTIILDSRVHKSVTLIFLIRV